MYKFKTNSKSSKTPKPIVKRLTIQKSIAKRIKIKTPKVKHINIHNQY